MKLLQIAIWFDWWTSCKCFLWSFSHLPRFNWSCWTTLKTQMRLIDPNVSNFTQNLDFCLFDFLVCPNLMNTVGINTW